MEEHKDYLDFKMKTGLSGIDAVEYLLNELKKHRGGKGISATGLQKGEITQTI